MALVYKACIANKQFVNAKNTNSINKPIIRDFSLTIEPGEFVALTGPSGAGKSTLLNIIAGLDKEYSGSLSYGDKASSARVALMFQEHRLMPWLTLQDNIMLVLDGNKNDKLARAQYWLEEVGLGSCSQFYPSQLSGGMLKRAALARAFAYEPDILLLDEPFSSLDIQTAAEIKERLLLLWQKQQTSILLVTHDVTEAVMLSDRVVVVSSSPMSIKHRIDIKSPRPRSPEMPDLSTVIKQVSTWLKDEATQMPPNKQTTG